jgi:glycosyltransferase involved in cell wall biosynthesis
MSHVLITPARDEADNLRRLERSLLEQTLPASLWIIVDDGSTDGTWELSRELAQRHVWVRALKSPGHVLREGALKDGRRTGRDVIAFHAGIRALDREYDYVFKLDADVSFEADYFARQFAKFDEDASLGIASGTCYEQADGEWRPYHVARGHVRGATRCYRWACLQDVLPLEERIGWDAVDEIKAQLRGWRTQSFRDLCFYHHRVLGARDGARLAWTLQGELAHYLGYRFLYLLCRALFRARREPEALAMIAAYKAAAARGDPRCADADVVQHLREQQSLRRLPLRLRQVLGRTG